MRQAVLVGGLGFGDEGKGSIVDFLTHHHKAGLVIRHNGGPQAAHNVVEPSGRWHTFAQFGSGTFAGAQTYLSRFMFVDLGALANEAHHLEEVGVAKPFEGLHVDRECPLVTPYHALVNRIAEAARGPVAKHGSCGMGFGEAVEDSIKYGPVATLIAADLENPVRLRHKLAAIYDRKLPLIARGSSTEQLQSVPKPEQLAERYLDIGRHLQLVDRDFLMERNDDTMIFEGAQGALLHQDLGFSPHVTWSDTSFENAKCLLVEAYFAGHIRTIGVTRSYHTRHGEGPMPTEHDGLIKYEEHNRDDSHQGRFRTGDLDLVLLRYGISILGCAEIAMTHMDVVRPGRRMVQRYEVLPHFQSFFAEDGTQIKQGPADYHRRFGLTQAMSDPGAIKTEHAILQLNEESVEESPVDIFASAFLDTIERHVEGPRVTLLSRGPTRLDKLEI